MSRDDIALQLFDIGAIQFGTFTLKSGIISPIYIDLRLIVSYPQLLLDIAEEMWKQVSEQEVDLVSGVPYTALPIATAISLTHHIPMIMRRKEVKEYGTRKSIEGVYTPGDVCLVIEDLITSGSSLVETVSLLRQSAIMVHEAAIVIDREQGGAQILKQEGVEVFSLFTLSNLLLIYEKQKKILPQTADLVREFIECHQFTHFGG